MSVNDESNQHMFESISNLLRSKMTTYGTKNEIDRSRWIGNVRGRERERER